MPDVQFDRHYRYDDLVRILNGYGQEYPHLLRMQSIGRSYEGRDIWLATITDFSTGQDQVKPALWVDGNIHAGELSASSACLYLIHRLTEGYSLDPAVTRCLQTRALYVCPRVNPDGAEWALADRPKIVRSSTRPYPSDEDPIGGLIPEDVDGDGRILMMRLRDPNGPWKVCAEDSRLLVWREPEEVGGEYYRLLPEGCIRNYDGVLIRIPPDKEGLDLNRNFPVRWRQDYEQRGAGPFPTSEPEVRAVAQFVATHPNITAGIAFHTHGGVLLRPYDSQGDEAFPSEDLWTYLKIGEKGTQLTGYPAASVYHDYRADPRDLTSGAFDTWLYDHMGVFSWTVEIWSPQREAGIEKYKHVDWYRMHPVEDDLKMLRWSDERLGGKGYVGWYPFEHPQLGQVELGGWDRLYAIQNPPLAFLQRELARFPDWIVWHLLISPRLELVEARAEPLGSGCYRVRMVVQNTGWLPTYVTKKALEKKVVRGVVCEIALPPGGALQVGEVRVEIGQLEGRAYKPSMLDDADATDDRGKAEWVVRASPGEKVKLTARHDRAGTLVTEVTLG